MHKAWEFCLQVLCLAHAGRTFGAVADRARRNRPASSIRRQRGLAVFLSPTAGYLVGFLPAAFATGWISNKVAQSTNGGWKTFAGFFVAATIGVIIDHAFGVAWLITYVGLSPFSAIIGDLAFVPGDLLKAAIAAYAGQFIFVNFGNRMREI